MLKPILLKLAVSIISSIIIVVLFYAISITSHTDSAVGKLFFYDLSLIGLTIGLIVFFLIAILLEIFSKGSLLLLIIIFSMSLSIVGANVIYSPRCATPFVPGCDGHLSDIFYYELYANSIIATSLAILIYRRAKYRMVS